MTMMVKLGAALGALVLATTATAGVAEARERRVHAEVQTKRGTAVGDSTITREKGLRARSTTWTGPNGKSNSVQDTRTWDRAAGTYDHDRTRTFANGEQRTVDASAQRTAPGQYEATRTVTNRDGESRTATGVITVDRQP
ncbi:MAG: hypothetical protein KJS97_12915 [Alphaproteobacteria bacterium]|nr:hypothetical protein [Alphaproteobacteria bacterium]